MKKFFAISLVLFGLAAVLVPLLAAQGHVDLLMLGNPTSPASSTLLREAGGHGNVTWAGLALMLTGMYTFLAGAIKAAVAFPGS